jgi:hypothetical protein
VRYALALALCQVIAACAGTIVLAASPRAGGDVVSADEECNCEHSSGVMCPMHRRSSSRPIPADAPRWCTGLDDSVFAVLPVFGALALPERIAHLARPELEPLVTAPRPGAPRSLDRPPDSPPPRG